MLERGTIISVTVEQDGDELAVACSAGATSLIVADAVDFLDPRNSGGLLFIGSESLTYTTVVDDTSTITLATPTANAYPIGEKVYLKGYEATAKVQLGDSDEMADATIPPDLIDQIAENVYEGLEQKAVELEYDDDDDVYKVLGLVDELPAVDGSYIDPATLPDPAPNDGNPPLLTPTYTTIPGLGAIFLKIEGLVNPDSLHYRVYVSATSGFTPGPGDILIDETQAGLFTARHMPDGSQFDYFVRDGNGDETEEVKLYYFRVQAWEDIDGDGPIGPEVSGHMDKTAGGDVAFRSIVGEHFQAETALATRIGVPTLTGERIDIYQGLQAYNSAEDVTAKLSTDGTPHYFRGEGFMEALTVFDKLAVSGTGDLLSGTTLTLRGSTRDPNTKPTVSMAQWPEVGLGTDLDPDGKRGMWTAGKFTVTNKALTSNVATLTIGTHTIIVGDSIVVSGVDATFDGTYTVTAVAATTVSYAKVASDVTSVASGGTVKSSHWFYCSTDGMSSSIIQVSGAGTLVNTYPIKNTGGGDIVADGGLTRIGTSWYVLAKFGSDWKVYNYGTLTPSVSNSAAGLWSYTDDASSTKRPAIGRNAGSGFLIIAKALTNGTWRMREYNTTGTIQTTTTSSNSPGYVDLAGVHRETWLFPAERYVVAPRTKTANFVYSTGGSNQSDHAWDIANGDTVCGYGYDGDNFFHLAENTSVMTRYTRNWWDTESSTWSVKNTWGDSNAAGTGVHESGPSPSTLFTAKKCGRLSVTSGSIPGGGGTDDPNRVYWYVGRGTVTDPNMFRQTDPSAGVITTFYDEVVFSGDNLSSRDAAFPAAAISAVKDDVGQTLLASDGSTGTFSTGMVCHTIEAVTGGGVVVKNAWAKGDGTAVSRTGATFGPLFGIAGILWGPGNGSTTYNLIDGRSRFIVGAGSYRALGGDEGISEASRTTAHIHTHGHTHNITSGGGHSHTINSTNHTGDNNTQLTGGANRVSTLNGTTGGSHAHGGGTVSDGAHDHGGNTGLPGDDTTSSANGPGAFPHTALNLIVKL